MEHMWVGGCVQVAVDQESMKDYKLKVKSWKEHSFCLSGVQWYFSNYVYIIKIMMFMNL